jgi:hypothetical protein
MVPMEQPIARDVRIRDAMVTILALDACVRASICASRAAH